MGHTHQQIQHIYSYTKDMNREEKPMKKSVFLILSAVLALTMVFPMNCKGTRK